MWGAFGKFMEGLLTGDRAKVEEVLAMSPGDTTCKACAEKTHKAGDPACSTRDNGFRCIAHNDDGSCVMSKASP